MPIRLATPQDANGIARVCVASWTRAYGPFVPAPALARLCTRNRAEFWRKWLTEKHSLVWVAEEDGQILGYLVLSDRCHYQDKQNPESAEIVGMYVHPKTWRCGIGSKLYGAALNYMQQRGVEEAVVAVLEGHNQAINFYQKLGFRRDGFRSKGDICGAPVTMARLCCELNPMEECANAA